MSPVYRNPGKKKSMPPLENAGRAPNSCAKRRQDTSGSSTVQWTLHRVFFVGDPLYRFVSTIRVSHVYCAGLAICPLPQEHTLPLLNLCDCRWSRLPQQSAPRIYGFAMQTVQKAPLSRLAPKRRNGNDPVEEDASQGCVPRSFFYETGRLSTCLEKEQRVCSFFVSVAAPSRRPCDGASCGLVEALWQSSRLVPTCA